MEFERIKRLEDERKSNSSISMEDFVNRKALKGLITSIAMSWFMQTTGSIIVINYASLEYQEVH